MLKPYSFCCNRGGGALVQAVPHADAAPDTRVNPPRPQPSSNRRLPVGAAMAMMAVATAGLAATLAGCGGSDDPRPATWPYVSAAIMTPNCATVSCHSRVAAVSGLDFSTADRGYISLTGLWSWIVDPTKTPSDTSGCRAMDGTILCQSNNRGLISPCNPAQSRLVQMLRGHGDAPRMPPDRPLAEADIRLVEAWIASGASSSARAPDGGVGAACAQVVADAGDAGPAGADGGTDGGQIDAASDAVADGPVSDIPTGAGGATDAGADRAPSGQGGQGGQGGKAGQSGQGGKAGQAGQAGKAGQGGAG